MGEFVIRNENTKTTCLMKGMFSNVILWVLISLLSTCTPGLPEYTATPAFYHWKSQLSPDQQTIQYLEDLGNTRLYIRYFDVALEAGEPVPISILQADTAQNIPFEVIPVVFITNEVMKSISPEDCKDLANRIIRKVRTIHQEFNETGFRELQIDCDWTESSRSNYFLLLRELKRLLKAENQILSSTLRLHQYNNSEGTGVPPSDRVMLMFYNMGEVNDFEEDNSILNLEAAARYLDNNTVYPLPMDMALPVFQWGCVFRDRQLVHLSGDLTLSELEDKERFGKISDNRFRVLKSTYLNGYFLYEGDEIRYESVSYDRLLTAAEMLSKVKHTREFTVAFYHLNDLAIKKFSPEQLSNLMRSIEQGN